MTEAVAYVYRITNKVNGMQYIGVSKNPRRRFNEHARRMLKSKSVIKCAMLKYGVENFVMDILCKASQKYCYELEAKVVATFNTVSPNGYNICSGGRGAIGLPGHLNGMYGRRGAMHPHYGKPGYSAGLRPSAETREKMRLSHLGQKRSPEMCARMKEIALNRSPELLAKMREARTAAIRKKFAERKASS
jgi:group I intron endonuclease